MIQYRPGILGPEDVCWHTLTESSHFNDSSRFVDGGYCALLQ